LTKNKWKYMGYNWDISISNLGIITTLWQLEHPTIIMGFPIF
jgi:hypothetical protein